MVQEQASQDRQGLGSSGTTGSSKLRQTQMVVCEPTEAEWPFDTTSYPQRNDLRRRKQHWMGVQFETLSDAWLLDSSRSSTVNQLKRTESGTTSTADFPIIKEHHSSHPRRQQHQFAIYQQARKYPLSTFDGTSNRNMEMVSSTQHLYTGSTCSKDSQQDCRYGISTHVHQEPMANQAASIPMDNIEIN
ncbi:hypothetical protein RMCBS344292_12386 [Rhizopus microsporus]|nr:hypothetical protein RMCBS344292_12386 [Rhizopus microsporus]